MHIMYGNISYIFASYAHISFLQSMKSPSLEWDNP